MRLRNAAAAVLLLLGGWSCSRDPNVVKQKYLESGNRYFEKSKYKEAVIMYRNALRKDMRFGEAYYRLGLTELRMEQRYWVDALRALRRAVELMPNHTEAKVRLADSLLLFYLADARKPANLRQEIEALADKLLEKDRNSVDGLRVKGYLLLRADNNYQEAIARLRRAHEIKPFQPTIVLALVQALLADAQAAEAEKLARELIEREKTFGPIYDLLLGHYLRANRLEEAEGVLKAKAANNPKEVGPLLQLAGLYAGLQRRQQMQATLEKITSNPKGFPNSFLLVGNFYARLREFDTAIRLYEKGVQANPKQAGPLRVRIAEALVAQGKPVDATRVLDQVLKENPSDDSAKAMRAALLIDPAHPEQVRAAVSELQALVSRMPKNAVLRFNLARALAARGEFAQARTQLQEAVKIDPSYLPPRLSLARLNLARREFPQALQASKEILELDRRNLEGRLILAQAYLGTGNPTQARQEIEETIKLHPNSADAVLQLGMLNVYERKFKDAEDIFQKLHRANPSDLRAVLGLSEVYALQSQFDKGIEALGAELAKQPDRLDLRIGVANLQVRAQKLDDAIANFKKVLERDPKSSDLHISIGETYRRKGDIPSAVAFFRKARELSPNNPAPYVPLAVLLDSTGRQAEARATYEQILKLQPDNPIALNNLAYMMAETGGDLDQALTLAQRARQKMPQDPNVADTLGWIYIKKNLSDNAIGIFRELVIQQPGNSTYRFHLGMALYQKGDKPSARKELQAALQSKPSPAEAAKIRELLAKVG
jgi:tetratricopeptide (TPR) repeat protein